MSATSTIDQTYAIYIVNLFLFVRMYQTDVFSWNYMLMLHEEVNFENN
jgi:hypothetical protein